VAPVMSPELQQLVANYSDGVRELILGARQLLFSELSEAREFLDVNARVIGYGTGASHRETIATLILSKSGVKIGIVGGATLPDPAFLLQGSGKVHRYVAIQEPADLKHPALRSLLRNRIRDVEGPLGRRGQSAASCFSHRSSAADARGPCRRWTRCCDSTPATRPSC
jgi:hypothetical protein